MSSENSSMKLLFALLWAFYGLLLGLCIYFGVLADLGFSPQFIGILGIVFCVVLAISCATSTQVRCISLLSLVCCTGRVGRSILKALAFAFVMAGPIGNVVKNGHEVMNMFVCTSALTYNLTRTKYNLMVTPFQEALLGIKHDMEQVEETLEGLSDVVQPLVDEVESESEINRLKAESDYMDIIQGDSLRSQVIEEKYKELFQRKKRKRESNGSSSPSHDAKIYEEEYKRKVEYRCQGLINEGSARCRQLFQDAYDNCKSKVKKVAAWLLCWPMKLTFICNLVEAFGGSSLCDSSHVIDQGFGEGYASLKNAKANLEENFKDVKIHYVIEETRPIINLDNVDMIRLSVLEEFEEKQSLFETFTQAIRRLMLTVIFLIVVFNASQYHENYLSDIEFDNKYVTKYFQKIDNRRKKRQRMHLLPFKRVENKNFLPATKIYPTPQDLSKIFKQTLLLIIQIMPTMTFILIDFVLYEALDLIRRHAHVEFTQEGEHNILLKVHGGGLVANIIRSLVKGFNVRKRVHVVHSNAACLPVPQPLHTKYLILIFGLYFAAWLLIFIEPMTFRLNRLICAYFYRKREKQRVLFLYNETLKKRVGYFKHLKDDILTKANEFRRNKQHNPLLRARIKGNSWLKVLSGARRRCLVCEVSEGFLLSSNKLIECSTRHCGATYCLECWKDVEEICYNCTPIDTTDTE